MEDRTTDIPAREVTAGDHAVIYDGLELVTTVRFSGGRVTICGATTSLNVQDDQPVAVRRAG